MAVRGCNVHRMRAQGLDPAVAAYAGLGLGVCSLMLSAWALLDRRSRRKQQAEGRGTVERFLNTASPSLQPWAAPVAGSVPTTPRRAPTGRVAASLAGTVPATSRRAPTDSQTAALERHLRTAILSSDSRERLVEDAMRRTGSDRAAAIRKVPQDLHNEDKRWS